MTGFYLFCLLLVVRLVAGECIAIGRIRILDFGGGKGMNCTSEICVDRMICTNEVASSETYKQPVWTCESHIGMRPSSVSIDCSGCYNSNGPYMDPETCRLTYSIAKIPPSAPLPSLVLPLFIAAILTSTLLIVFNPNLPQNSVEDHTFQDVQGVESNTNTSSSEEEEEECTKISPIIGDAIKPDSPRHTDATILSN